MFHVVFVLNAAPDAQSGTVSGAISMFGPLRGLEVFAEDGDDVDVIIGMDILGRGALHVGFDGRYMFSW